MTDRYSREHAKPPVFIPYPYPTDDIRFIPPTVERDLEIGWNYERWIQRSARFCRLYQSDPLIHDAAMAKLNLLELIVAMGERHEHMQSILLEKAKMLNPIRIWNTP